MTAIDHERRDQNRTRRRLQQHKRLRGGLALGLAAAALLSTAGTVFAGPGPAPADAAPDSPLLSPVSLVQPSGSARPAEAEGGPVPAAEARVQAAQEQAAAQKAADRKAAGAAAEKAARAKAAAGKPVDDPAAAKAYAAGQLPGF
ncbi:hypothetical protein HER39_08205, partial [Arthrobacter deserti]|nr:hypothetical protein [Arthrobacter deserti]